VSAHLASLRARLAAWADVVADGATEDEFVAAALAELGDDAAAYDGAMPLWQSYAGLRRWADKHAAA
jgi:hypothetical protein